MTDKLHEDPAAMKLDGDVDRTEAEPAAPKLDGEASRAEAGLTIRELFGIGNVLAMPVLLGGVRASAVEPKPGSEVGGAGAGPLKPGPEIYQSIGVEPIINCRGTFTIIGGLPERTER